MQAKLVISFDFELGWGSIENGRWAFREGSGVYENLRGVFKNLLNHLDVLEIPCIWGVVGAMLCAPQKNDFTYLPEPIKSNINYAVRNSKPSSFDGRDLFDELLNRNINHTIGSHSYSHVRYSHDLINKEVVQKDLQNFLDAFPACIPKPEIFIFPQNHEMYYEIIKSNGFKYIRGNELAAKSRLYCFKRIKKIADVPPLARNDQIKGLYRQTGSMFFGPGNKSNLMNKIIHLRAMRGLKYISNGAGCLHVYTHPFNLAENAKLNRLFLDFLSNSARLRDSGKFDISATMLPCGN